MKVNSKLVFLVVFLGLSALVIGGRYLVAFPTIPQPENSNTDTVSWDVKLSHPYVKHDSDGDVFLNFHIKGQEVKSAKRAPINLVLVIDRSGSMSEKGKL